MSTSSLEVGRRSGAAARARRIDFVDAPVAGQTIGAEAGTLAIYAGGTRRAFAPRPAAAGGDRRPGRGSSTSGRSGSGYAVKLLLNLTWFIQASPPPRS